MKKFLMVAGIFALLGAAALGYLVMEPHRAANAPKNILVDLPRGTSTAGIAQKLAAAGVIQHPMLFRLARALRPFSKLQAGEYEFGHEESPLEILDRISRGDVHFYELSVPEGSNMFDIAEAVGKLGFLRRNDFLNAAKDPTPIRDLAPKAPSLEGFLFPATYRLTRSATIDQVVKMMTDQFRKQWKAAQQATGVKKADALEIVTMASLVEKESGQRDERPLVASVYWNRVKKSMKLDADPSTIYAAMLDGRWRGTIYRSDLNSQNPFNTYQVPGLPPGPIASPGLASLEAALKPAESDYLYFVAKGDGSNRHNFSASYEAHQRFVASYRKNRGR